MARLLGSAQVVVDGDVLQTLPGATLDVGGAVRTARTGTRSVHGYSQTEKEAMVECEITLPQGYSIKQLHDITDATISFQGDSGQSYVIRGAWCTEPPTVKDGDDASVTVKFSGPAAEEVIG